MITLKNLNYKIKRRTLLSDLNFEIMQGEYIYITGESGTGKTTLLNIIGGLIKPNEGEVIIDSISSSQSDFHKIRSNKISYILQEYGLLTDETVLRNMEIAKSLCNATVYDDQQSSYIIETLELTQLLKTKAKNLSGGEIQRVKIAQALIRNTPIILCDEPTSSLDNRLKHIVLDLLEEEHHRNNKTIVHVTHDLSIIKNDRKTIKL